MKDILPEAASARDVPELEAEPRPKKRSSKSSPDIGKKLGADS
jgi:hypothetical protein